MAYDPDTDMELFTPATLTIDLTNLRHNLRVFRHQLSHQTRVMAMVKADAYGCGLVEVGKVLQDAQVDYLAVAYMTEGQKLRDHGIELPIMVMNPLPQEFPELVRSKLEPELSGIYMLLKWSNFVQESDLANYPVHLEVDTGMKRLGFGPDDAGQILEILPQSPAILIRSVFSHLTSSFQPEHDEFTKTQIGRFESWYRELNRGISGSPLRHLLNSAGIYRFPDHQYEMVRLGIGLYGVGLETLEVHRSLRPVQTLTASITCIQEIEQDETVGYGRQGNLDRNGRIGVVNLGYADGLPRLAGNGRFSVWIEGQLCPIVGPVCMDMTMVDISSCASARPGTAVQIYGPDHPVLALSNAAQTIPYETITANHHRLRRVIRNE